ncbi:MAG: CusA/CzcA family heavy metal efflux RND transporter [Candidatus Kapabacteria bacterium]|nr:CusA/CzcA family heavy metal efflux RND transporter [Candidatus Kapabacteria bacterium]
MFNKIIAYSIKNKLIIGIFTIALISFGVYSLINIPIDAVPDITNNQVQVITVAPTLASQEAEQFLTYPIEKSMATIPNVIELRSISRFGLSLVTVVFKDNVDMYLARQLVAQQIKEAEENIPHGIGRPELAPVSTGLGEIYQYLIQVKKGYENKYSLTDLRTVQDWIVKRQLLGTPGVAEVSSLGGFIKQYEVSVNPDRLRSMNTSIIEIYNALEKNNENTGAAYIDKKPNSYFIRGMGLVSSLKDIEKIVIKNVNSVPLLIKDVATVRMSCSVRYGAVTKDGTGEVVGGMVMMLKDENSGQVIERVKEKIKLIEKNLPIGLYIEPFIDRTNLVDRTIRTVTTNLIEGGLIVIFVLVLFLGNMRAGLLVASVLPLSMLFTLTMMYSFGISGNLMSLGAIDFGLIVDAAVIIVESIVFRLEHYKEKDNLSQSEMDIHVFKSASKIRQSASFGELIILIVYLPILSLVGIEGKMFRPMAMTVGFAIIGAFILSLTYVPMMSSIFLDKKLLNKKHISDQIMKFFQTIYSPLLIFALKRKAIIVGTTLIILALSVIGFIRLGGEFIPRLEEGDLLILGKIKAGSSISQTIETSTKIEKILKNKFPEVKSAVSKIGVGEIPTDPTPMESCDIVVSLEPKSLWKSASSLNELIEKMQKELSVLPGASYEFLQPIETRFSELMTGTRSDIAVKIYGEDLNLLTEKAEEAKAIIQDLKGIGDIKVEQMIGLPHVQVKFNRDKLALYGLNIKDLSDVLKAAFAGASAGVIFEGDRRFELVVRLDSSHRQEISDIRGLFVPLASGEQIPLEQVADINYEEGPQQIARDDGKRRITIGINVRNRDVQSLVREITEKIEKQLKLPANYYVTYGGQFQNLVEANKRLTYAVPLALILILLILFFTFKSIRETLLIFTAIPFSAVGGIVALNIREMPFSISAGVGFIALFGVSVLNGIVLISHLNSLEKAGYDDLYNRIIKGTKDRLRPVLMTAFVASFGFLPMALSSSPGAEVQKPVATVVIGGLISSTFLTLIVLPILYSIFSKKIKSGDGNILANNVIGIIFLFIASTGLYGKDLKKEISLEKAIQIGLVNNLAVKVGNQEIQVQEKLSATALDLGKTTFSLNYGQINTPKNDNEIGISQKFSFPTLYSSQSDYYAQNILSYETRHNIIKNNLIKEIKSVYFRLLILNQRLELVNHQDSIYSEYLQKVDMKFQKGETSSLENANAKSEFYDIKDHKRLIENEISINENKLNVLISDKQNYTINLLEDYIKKLNVPDQSMIANFPELKLAEQNIKLNKSLSSIERNKLMPEFSLGYVNKSFTDSYIGRFSVYEFSIDIPIWFMPQNKRVEASELNEEIAKINYQYLKNGLLAEIQTNIDSYKLYLIQIETFKQYRLPQATLIEKNTLASYSAGDIGYLEYLQNLKRSFDIRESFFTSIDTLNQIIINIEYLTGVK